MRRGNHSRTSDGKAGCVTATPTPMRKVAPNRTGMLGPKPRRAPKTAMAPSPANAERGDEQRSGHRRDREYQDRARHERTHRFLVEIECLVNERYERWNR